MNCIDIFKCSVSIESKVSPQHLYIFLFCEEVYYYYLLLPFNMRLFSTIVYNKAYHTPHH